MSYIKPRVLIRRLDAFIEVTAVSVVMTMEGKTFDSPFDGGLDAMWCLFLMQ